MGSASTGTSPRRTQCGGGRISESDGSAGLPEDVMVILINNHKQREAEKKWEKENARLYLKEKQAQGYQELQRKHMRLPAAGNAGAKHHSQS